MNKSTFVIVVLGMLLMGVLGLCVGLRDANTLLIQVNSNLLNAPASPHPVHDAQITPWYEPAGSVKLIVNGHFVHHLPGKVCRPL
jgi:hypothetical protein